MPTSRSDDIAPRRLRCATVLRVQEHACEAWTEGKVVSIPFAPQFPSPRAERVSPGHLIAVATAPHGGEVVVWRWYDVVVLGADETKSIRLWEPAHGEVTAQTRQSHQAQEPGSRAYASAGLPGADWWVAGRVTARPEDAAVELEAVDMLYTENQLWAAAFGLET